MWSEWWPRHLWSLPARGWSSWWFPADGRGFTFGFCTLNPSTLCFFLFFLFCLCVWCISVYMFVCVCVVNMFMNIRVEAEVSVGCLCLSFVFCLLFEPRDHWFGLAAWLAGWLAGWLLGWLLGWLAGSGSVFAPQYGYCSGDLNLGPGASARSSHWIFSPAPSQLFPQR